MARGCSVRFGLRWVHTAVRQALAYFATVLHHVLTVLAERVASEAALLKTRRWTVKARAPSVAGVPLSRETISRRVVLCYLSRDVCGHSPSLRHDARQVRAQRGRGPGAVHAKPHGDWTVANAKPAVCGVSCGGALAMCGNAFGGPLHLFGLFSCVTKEKTCVFSRNPRPMTVTIFRGWCSKSCGAAERGHGPAPRSP